MTNDFMLPDTYVVTDQESKKLARDASKISADNDARLDRLETKVNTLSILNEALFKLLAAKNNLDESALQQMMEKVDADRKAKQETKLTCSECKMQTPSVKGKCLYCGGKLIGDTSKSLFT